MSKNLYLIIVGVDALMSLLALGVVWQFVANPGIRAIAGLALFSSLAATAWILKQRLQD